MNSLVSNILSKPSAGGLLPYTGPELFAWWDPSDSLNVTKSGGRFDQVNDKSGNGYNLTSSGASRPFDSRTQNGLELLDFQESQYISASHPDITQPFILNFIGNTDSISGVKRIFDTSSGGRITLLTNGSNYYLYSGIDGQYQGSWATSAAIITVIINSGNALIYENGILEFSKTTGTENLGSIRWGTSRTLSQYWNGALGESFIYSNIITNPQLNQTNQYLANKWAIPYTDIV